LWCFFRFSNLNAYTCCCDCLSLIASTTVVSQIAIRLLVVARLAIFRDGSEMPMPKLRSSQDCEPELLLTQNDFDS
jgi:hypothetical protein